MKNQLMPMTTKPAILGQRFYSVNNRYVPAQSAVLAKRNARIYHPHAVFGGYHNMKARAVIDPTEQRLAEVWYSDYLKEREDEREREDIKQMLADAAPDLLNAVRDLLSHSPVNEQHTRWVLNARAAVKKATGNIR